jgi:O-antigen/teichoic acid export membrane protein
VLCPIFGIIGGLMALAVLPAFTLVISWLVGRTKAWWPERPFSHGFIPKEARTALAFVPMAVVNTVGAPLLQLLVRDQVAAHDGMAAVGLLQGVIRLSEMYLGIAGSVFVMYYFPRFSEIRDPRELFRELRKGVIVIAPFVALVSLCVYLLRDYIVHIVFTPDFLPMRDLFGWQMVGNTLKMTGSLFAYMLLAKIHAFRMALVDTATMLMWWGFSIYFISLHGAVGATEAYAATYGIYAIGTAFGAYVFLRKLRSSSSAVQQPS